MQVYTICVHDASAEQKTADNLYKLLVDVITEVEKSWEVDVVAVTSDASGESHKACRMLHEQFPKFVVIDCQAHQVSITIHLWYTATIIYYRLISLLVVS